MNRNSLTFKKIKVRRVKYLNNIVEQDHRTIKRRIAITTGFKEFESAQRTLAGMEIINIIRKNQTQNPGAPALGFCVFSAEPPGREVYAAADQRKQGNPYLTTTSF